MTPSGIRNTLRAHRERLGLSQEALAERVGVSRQAILAVERGRQVPSTGLALRLAEVLGCTVEDLFRLEGGGALEVRMEPGGSPDARRVVVGRVGGRWAAHRLAGASPASADAIASGGAAGTVRVRPLADPERLDRNVLVAGCAPLIALLAERAGRRFHDARLVWLRASSHRALDLLAEGMVHVAGLHLAGDGADNVAAVRERFPGERMLVVNLTRWREGLVVAPGNPMAIRSASDLLRPDVRVVGREPGAGAQHLLVRLLAEAGEEARPVPSALADGHEDVARRVLYGAADAGVAIESVALHSGLAFVPLAEERFDLVLPASLAERAPVSRLLDALDDPAFRTEIAHLPGYDGAICGHVTTVEAA